MTVGFDRPVGLSPARLYLLATGGFIVWLILTMLWHFTFGHGRELAHIQFLGQDFPALLIAILGLLFLSPLASGKAPELPAPTWKIVLPLILLFALWSWAGHYIVFQDYAISRDEEVADFAAAYMRDGLLARPIPPQWIAYRRAIMPEFFLPFGADTYWASAYLPVNSAIRALWWRMGDPNLAGPSLLVVGLVSLWRIALRLFPDRPDATWVVLLVGLSSAQLSVMAMTPYAMTGHFALNMLWLALFLHGGWRGHAGAGLTLLIAGGLHQWHFPLLFLLPFLGWLLLRRRFAALLFHGAIGVALILIWARFWPGFLHAHLGPPADILPAANVQDKVQSLFARLERWQPLFNLSRLLAWNNVLMVPLAIIGSGFAAWRGSARGGGLVLPLMLGCLIGCVLALFQGYGWGYRYGQGFIGSFCLLAGFGWLKLRSATLRPVMLATGLSLGCGAFLTVMAHNYVAPYAGAHRLIHRARTDVVLVDPRGGLFATDLVRTQHGGTQAPVVMNLGMLAIEDIHRLCARNSVAVLDRKTFGALGLPPARRANAHIAMLRNELDRLSCAALLRP